MSLWTCRLCGCESVLVWQPHVSRVLVNRLIVRKAFPLTFNLVLGFTTVLVVVVAFTVVVSLDNILRELLLGLSLFTSTVFDYNINRHLDLLRQIQRQRLLRS